MPQNDLPALVEINSLAEKYTDTASTRGRPVIGWFCTYTPVELLRAAGLFPRRILPAPGRAMTRADSYIDRNFCPYVRSCLGQALDGMYQHFQGLIFVNSCDAMRRMFDVWRHNLGGQFMYLLDLPRACGEPAIAYYTETLRKLAGEIEKHFSAGISTQSLEEQILASNQVRSLLKELYYANSERGLPLAASQVRAVVQAGMLVPPETLKPTLERLLQEVKGVSAGGNAGKPRVFLTGSIMENPQVLDLIEEVGAVVVADDLCTGTRAIWDSVEIVDDPFVSLARYYLGRTPCPRMKHAHERFDHIFRLIDDFKVDGVVFYTMKFCDPFLFDVPLLKERLVARNIPSLSLESDYTPGTMGRVRTRVEAFIEMLRQNVPA